MTSVGREKSPDSPPIGPNRPWRRLGLRLREQARKAKEAEERRLLRRKEEIKRRREAERIRKLYHIEIDYADEYTASQQARIDKYLQADYGYTKAEWRAIEAQMPPKPKEVEDPAYTEYKKPRVRRHWYGSNVKITTDNYDKFTEDRDFIFTAEGEEFQRSFRLPDWYYEVLMPHLVIFKHDLPKITTALKDEDLPDDVLVSVANAIECTAEKKPSPSRLNEVDFETSMTDAEILATLQTEEKETEEEETCVVNETAKEREERMRQEALKRRQASLARREREERSRQEALRRRQESMKRKLKNEQSNATAFYKLNWNI